MAACHLPSDWRPCREDNDFFLIISFPPRTERLLRCQWHIWRIPFVPFYPHLAPNYSWSAPCMDVFFFSCSSSLFHHASALFMLAYRLKQLRLKSVLNKQNKKKKAIGRRLWKLHNQPVHLWPSHKVWEVVYTRSHKEEWHQSRCVGHLLLVGMWSAV